MIFALPSLLWLLLLVPLAAWLLWYTARQNRRRMAGFIHARLLDALTAGYSPARRKFRAALWLAALALLIIAAARPQWGYHWVEVKRRGVDIIIGIDTSRSMLAEDIKPNRLERAKLAALDLAQQAGRDRVGLVAFAGSAFLQCPLTMDTEAFRQSVMILDTEIIPQGGTALAEAINVARAGFTNAGESHKVIVLFTDGEDHEAGVKEAAVAAEKEGVKLFMVGVGTPEGEELRVTETTGRRETARDAGGAPIRTRLEERLLNDAAKAGGGFYLRLSGARTIETLYEKGIAPLPKAEQSARMVRQYHERYHWPLGLAFLLLVVEILVPDRSMPKRWFNRHPLPGAALLLALALLSVTSVRAVSPAEAQRNLENGRNKAAKKAYEELLLKTPDDPRLRYNLGVAAFRDKDFERAAREFEGATMAPENLDLQQRAFYNAASAHYRAGEAESDLAKKKTAWQTATNQLTDALRLSPKDEDARQNLDLITRRLVQLEQQQQQQQQNQDQKDQNQDQQDQKDQPKNPDQSKNDQSKKQPDQKDQSQQPQPQDQQPQNQPQPGEQKQGQQGKPENQKPEDQSAQQGNPMQVITMTPEQARQLLEAAKVEEKVLPFVPQESDPRKRPPRNVKNW
jgi:Ca-activated chloride channel family protein